jgi:hypothetical protein
VKDDASQFQNFQMNFHKFYATCVPKMPTGAHKAQRMASTLTSIFLERYHKDGDEFLNHIGRVRGDETWVSFVNVETKEQSAMKAVDAHIHQRRRKI